MKCEICGVSMFNKMLHRTKPKGDPDGGFQCIDCIKKTELELHNNIVNDTDYKVISDIEKTIIPNKNSIK
jgi:hypothetical protein